MGFSSTKALSNFGSTTTSTIQVAGNAGYFVIDKLAVGLQPDLHFSFFKSINGEHQSAYYSSIGPFLRYYLLSEGQKTNIFIQSNYSLGIVKVASLDASYYNSFAFSAGPEIFLNSSVGVQLSVDYVLNRSINGVYANTNTFQVGLGFQFHL